MAPKLKRLPSKGESVGVVGEPARSLAVASAAADVAAAASPSYSSSLCCKPLKRSSKAARLCCSCFRAFAVTLTLLLALSVSACKQTSALHLMHIPHCLGKVMRRDTLHDKERKKARRRCLRYDAVASYGCICRAHNDNTISIASSGHWIE